MTLLDLIDALLALMSAVGCLLIVRALTNARETPVWPFAIASFYLSAALLWKTAERLSGDTATMIDLWRDSGILAVLVTLFWVVRIGCGK